LSRRVNQQKKPLAPITKQDNFTHIAAKKFSSRLPLFLIQIVALHGTGADAGREQGARPAGDRQAEQSAMEAVLAFFEKTDAACRCGKIAGRG
jgi:hypothetical protein